MSSAGITALNLIRVLAASASFLSVGININRMKNKKIVYETQWVANDNTKQYPHGWGFIAPLVEFPQDADPAWCAEMCRQNLSNDEFSCIGATPRGLINGNFSFSYPKNGDEYAEWKSALAEKEA